MHTFSNNLSSRLFVALDFPEVQQALSLAKTLAPLNVSYKVGMQLFYAGGIAVIQQLQEGGHTVFVDLKLHDIPNTVAGAIHALVKQGVRFLNIHTQGGEPMMRAAVQSAKSSAERLGVKPPTLLGVTLLTSLGQQDLTSHLKVSELPLPAYVTHMAEQAKRCGLDGVVCSAHEASQLRAACGPEFLLVTPGIRLPENTGSDDQSRIMSPGKALQNGASHLVVGRPISQSTNPFETTQTILEEMALALAGC